MQDVFVGVSIVVMTYYDQKYLGEERVYLAYISTSLFFTEGSQDRVSSRAGTWRQRPWRRAAYWLAPMIQQPRDGPTTMD